MTRALNRRPPNYRPVKRISQDKLYVIQGKEYPINGAGEFKTHYMVVSPRQYLKIRDFPRIHLLGEYLPSSEDQFIVDIHGFFSLDRETPVQGIDLVREMERQGRYKAFYVS